MHFGETKNCDGTAVIKLFRGSLQFVTRWWRVKTIARREKKSQVKIQSSSSVGYVVSSGTSNERRGHNFK